MSKGTTKCGWCLTGDHDNCLPEIKYYDQTWHCTCAICHPEISKGKNNDQLVKDPIQD